MKDITAERGSIVYYSFILIFLIGLFAGLYLARKFLIPVAFAALFAMLLLPVCNFLEAKLKKRWAAVSISVFILFITLMIFVGFLTWQISSFASDFSTVKQDIIKVFQQFTAFLQNTFGLQISNIISKATSSLSSYLSSAFQYLQTVVVGFGKTIIGIIIVLVYVFFFLFYRAVFTKFILKISPKDKKEKTKEIVSNISKVSYQYLGGRLIVISIMAVFLSVGLSIIGVKHAIFFGVLAAFLDLIPFIGIIIGAGLPLLMTLITKQSITAFLGVLAVFIVGQLIENYFLTPKVVGSKVRLNPLFTLMIVLIGGYIWQVAGMILFIPMLGMAKVLFDHVDSLNPYGYLIGDPNHRTDKSAGWTDLS